ncbi:MAG: hypothetical protein HQL19_03065 [Candidatus Omnitrophica bacterium]|nr:hypothetical protein [Candidatus Omnitrophota bacterium]
MAATPEGIRLLWKALEGAHERVAPAVWDAMDIFCVARLDEMIAIASRAGEGPVPVEDARVITALADRVRRFLQGFKRSSDGIGGVKDGVVMLSPIALELVAHYVGNDLYKIILIADVYDAFPEPLAAGAGVKIIANATMIKDFLKDLKEKTR